MSVIGKVLELAIVAVVVFVAVEVFAVALSLFVWVVLHVATGGAMPLSQWGGVSFAVSLGVVSGAVSLAVYLCIEAVKAVVAFGFRRLLSALNW